MNDFEVKSPRQIIAFLSAMRDKKQLLDVHLTGSEAISITAIIEIDEGDGVIIIDEPKDGKLSESKLTESAITLEGFLDHIKISFTTEFCELRDYGGREVIALMIPKTLTRLQRREFYRVPTPIITPVVCKIPATSWEGPVHIDLPLRNISFGGILAFDEQMQIDISHGKIYRNCTIFITATENFVADLEVRNSFPTVTPNGHMGAKIGFQFIKFDGIAETILQKYINRLELEQRSIKR